MDQILGQSRALDVLQAALQSGRLHHAFIFHGPPGVGKFTAALAFAKIVLCHDPQRDLAGRPEACGACASCRLIESRSAAVNPNKKAAKNEQAGEAPPATAAMHPDLHVVAKELARFSSDRTVRERKLMTIPVDVLEEHLLGPVYRAAQLQHRKVFILDEAELLDNTGQNLLLKTLEEPPAGTHIVLITSSEDRLLPTIRSRCQRVAFLPLPDELIRKWLDGRVEGWSDQQKQWAVDFAAGSLGRAKLALDYELVGWSQRVLPALDAMRQGRFPADLGTTMAGSIDDFAKAWVDRHENASKEAANKLAAGLMWAMIAQHARRRLAEAAAQATPGDAEAAEPALLPWLGVIDALNQVESELAANVNLGLVADHLVSLLYRALAPQRDPVPAGRT